MAKFRCFSNFPLLALLANFLPLEKSGNVFLVGRVGFELEVLSRRLSRETEILSRMPAKDLDIRTPTKPWRRGKN
jgi:hypothetical protein